MIEVREATDDEIPLVREIMLQAFEEYRDNLVPPSGALRESLEDVRKSLALGGAVLAFLEGQPAGSARYDVQSDHIYTSRISVIPSVRGRGVASQILTFIDHLALQRGFGEVRLSTREVMEENQRLYFKHGYQVIARELHPAGEGIVLMLSKALGVKGEE